jgi:hypothetical protein
MDDSIDLYTLLLESLEDLARRILEGKLHSVQDMWQFEIDLVRFQLEQQRAMNVEEERKDEVNARLEEVCRAKESGWEILRQQCQDELEHSKKRFSIYSHAHAIARKLGDTLAWLFFDNLQITSRSRDSSMPSPHVHKVPEGHGLQGILAIAEMLCKAGAGLPILHDITSCLRTGDITFYSPGDDPLTIEVKTRLKGYQGDRMILETKIYCASTPAEDAKWNALAALVPQEISRPQNMQDVTVVDPAFQQPLAMKEKLKRQLGRMAKATALQVVRDGGLLRLGERELAIVKNHNSEQSMHHYDILQELTRDAKSKGFACRSVDDAFVYIAMYRESPLNLLESQQIVLEQWMIEDYQHAGISIAFPEADKNFIFPGAGIFKSPSFVPPFFLYPLPPDIIIDLMWKRLEVVVLINLGKLVAVLQSVGLNARLPKNTQEFEELFLPLSTEILLPDGRKIHGQFVNLQYYGEQIAHEFLSLQGFVDRISAMAEVTVEQAGKEEVYNHIFPPESTGVENTQGDESTADAS